MKIQHVDLGYFPIGYVTKERQPNQYTSPSLKVHTSHLVVSLDMDELIRRIEQKRGVACHSELGPRRGGRIEIDLL